MELISDSLVPHWLPAVNVLVLAMAVEVSGSGEVGTLLLLSALSLQEAYPVV